MKSKQIRWKHTQKSHIIYANQVRAHFDFCLMSFVYSIDVHPHVITRIFQLWNEAEQNYVGKEKVVTFTASSDLINF